MRSRGNSGLGRVLFASVWPILVLPILVFLSGSALAAERAIDPAASTLTVKVWKTGLFSAFAHNHDISAPIKSGTVREGDKASVKFTVDARRMTVLDPEASESTRAEVQKNMLSDQVLDAQRYPEIVFESTGLSSDKIGVYDVSGTLTLHGQTHPIHVAVKLVNAVSQTLGQPGSGKYEGSAKLKQTTFGIQPISIGGGAVKVKDEVDIVFVIVLR